MFHLSFTCAVLALVLGFYGKGEIDYELITWELLARLRRKGTEQNTK